MDACFCGKPGVYQTQGQSLCADHRDRRNAFLRGDAERIAKNGDAEDPDQITAHDRERGNVMVRAGWLRGMAAKLPPGDDRVFLLRASRSLKAYAEFIENCEQAQEDAHWDEADGKGHP